MKENHILIGLGGTGGKVLKAFRKRLYLKGTKRSVYKWIRRKMR